MTGPEHYREAELLLEDGPMDEQEPQAVRDDIARAQVHATLALAAATAMNDAENGFGATDWNEWRRAASANKPQETS